MNRDAGLHPLKLSVFTIANDTASRCRTVLGELRRQTARAQMEIIVVSPNHDGIEESVFSGFGAWQWFILP
jgi:hypothetical protein